MTRYESISPLRANQGVRIVELDETGAIVGSWIGYWNPKRGSVALYPDNSPTCSWRVPRDKKTVSDRIVRYNKPKKPEKEPEREMIPPPVKRRYSPFPGKDAKPVLLQGQEEFKF